MRNEKQAPLTIALPKGRMFGGAVELLKSAGYLFEQDLETTRKLVLEEADGSLRLLLVRLADVPMLVQEGIADIGIVCQDLLLDGGWEVHELLPLGYAYCQLCLCGLPEHEHAPIRRVASKYPRIAREHFRRQGMEVETFKMHGSLEIAPLLGIADAIVDIVDTGRTLQENGLIVYEQMFELSARLIASPSALKAKPDELQRLVRRLESTMQSLIS